MKKVITLATIVIASITNAQVIIGNSTGSAAVKTSVLLEFATNTNKGLILPYVRTLPASPAEGTLVLDATTPTNARVKYYNGTWFDLSGNNGNITTALANQPTVAQVTESADSKTIIGAETTTVDGVLVLESTTQSMILPIVDDVQNIPNPSPGMIVYINKANAKRFAVFNGTRWSFWRAA